jgi:hypothetical protein
VPRWGFPRSMSGKARNVSVSDVSVSEVSGPPPQNTDICWNPSTSRE